MERYEKYKDSGVEWIGKIPNSWAIKKLKYVAILKSGDNIISEQINESDAFPVFGGNGLRGYFSAFTHEGNFVLIGRQGALCGNINYASGKFWASEHAIVCHLQTSASWKWFGELLKIMNLNQYSQSAAQPGLAVEKIKNLEIPYPPISEQTTIANYLDKKTSELDTLISKKETLIELLNEERTAIINQAVTKGLDPDVEMKDSGVEWLGEIPAHWKMSKLKYVSMIKYGLGQPPKQKDSGLPIIRATNVFRGKISKENLVFVDPDDIPWNRDPVLKENDIIVVRSGAYTGDSAIIPYEFEGAITGYDMVLRALTVNPKFVAFCLLSTYLLDNQLFLERLRAAQPHLNAEELGNSFLVLPNIEEQNEIVSHIEIEHKRVDDLISKTEQEITLLKEYKTALISEVVTGKVKVI